MKNWMVLLLLAEEINEESRASFRNIDDCKLAIIIDAVLWLTVIGGECRYVLALTTPCEDER